MRIEISAGGIAAIAVSEFQVDMQSFLSGAEDIISSFKTVKSDIYNLSGGVGTLQGALDGVAQRITQEETANQEAQAVKSQADQLLELASRIDGQVARDVNRNKEALYGVNPWLRPATSEQEEKESWGDKVWSWLCGAGEQIAEDVKTAWNWAKDTAKKAWDGLVAFYEEHWYEIINWGVTILCAIGSMVAIALIPVTGGASILLIAAVSGISGAIVAATRSITTQQRDKGCVDWGEVGKEAAIAGVVGAVTGAIGAGVGGAITSGLSNTGLGATLLSSSSTAVRVGTSAAISSASEVVTGMATRGAGEAVESYLETGTVNLGDVWDAAADPQQMLMDAAIGGVSGGVSAAKTPAAGGADVPDADGATASADTEVPNGGSADIDGSTAQSADIDGPKPTYTKEELASARQKAVDKAWKQERELVLQGKGTRDWTPSQQAELIKYGKVSGFEGQHMLNAADYPQFAGDPNNIQFLTPAEHFYGAHGAGYDKPSYHNSTSGYFDPSTGIMNPFANGQAPAAPVIDLTSTVEASQVDFLESLGRPYGYGRHEDNMAGYNRIRQKKTPNTE